MSQPSLICRLCSKEKQPLVPILEDNPLNVKEKMLKLLKISVSPTSSLPKQLCLDCLTKLNNFNEFYVQTHEIQVILQLLFNEKSETIVTTTSSTQTDAPKDENQFYIIEELTNEDSQAISEIEIEEEEVEDVLVEIDEKETSSVARARRKFDRFDCYLCHEQLPGNSQFTQHFIDKHPDEELKYQCYVCSGFVKKYRSFTRHVESHTEKRFSCDVCNQKFSQKITLISHLSSHSDVKKFECTECNLSFKQNSSLFKHRKQKHLNAVPWCDICKRKFVNNETYQQHIRSKHNQGEKNIFCDKCNKSFASKSALSYHKMSIHTKSEAWKCSKCNEEFKNQVTLARHVKKCESVKK